MNDNQRMTNADDKDLQVRPHAAQPYDNGAGSADLGQRNVFHGAKASLLHAGPAAITMSEPALEIILALFGIESNGDFGEHVL